MYKRSYRRNHSKRNNAKRRNHSKRNNAKRRNIRKKADFMRGGTDAAAAAAAAAAHHTPLSIRFTDELKVIVDRALDTAAREILISAGQGSKSTIAEVWPKSQLYKDLLEWIRGKRQIYVQDKAASDIGEWRASDSDAIVSEIIITSPPRFSPSAPPPDEQDSKIEFKISYDGESFIKVIRNPGGWTEDELVARLGQPPIPDP